MKLSAILFLVLAPTSVFANDVNADALKKTQDLLNDPVARQKAFDTQAAKDSDANVKKLTGGDSKSEDEMYKLAADILPELMKEANGDPQKMAQILESQKSNPAAFLNRLPAAQQAKIKELAEKVKDKARKNP